MTKETKISTIVSAIIAINMVLMAFGITAFEDITEETVYVVVSVALTVIKWAHSHWKNNDFTPEAVMGTQLTRRLKRQFLDADEEV